MQLLHSNGTLPCQSPSKGAGGILTHLPSTLAGSPIRAHLFTLPCSGEIVTRTAARHIGTEHTSVQRPGRAPMAPQETRSARCPGPTSPEWRSACPGIPSCATFARWSDRADGCGL
jgi:hypothetical protein